MILTGEMRMGREGSWGRKGMGQEIKGGLGTKEVECGLYYKNLSHVYCRFSVEY